ncbi:hypothetical protein PTSG_01092 [Salpingoeca rosetta]|uniref:Talin IBS2B domain-containing protein n=1 Tax=Salpingoeca rosetta (strain ATCC 50818 / BSB-021) TaxID=946362 RepID=F2U0S7_SALR5|nr:uncharacterized protein PTSG_01092 [Salpingoeca rosetta]EGD80501.1 hypothetical protein PTSG_01092 [Salpingoeca rosetta]|eukprot:XP_004997062.1 hypothetical protein PTSG_01092 [Salpingoeca rosetta]
MSSGGGTVTDNRRQSGYLPMLAEGAHQDVDLALLASNAQSSAQMGLEALLLRDRDSPISGMSFTACQDALTANSKKLTACIKSVHDTLMEGSDPTKATPKLVKDIAESTEHLILLLETVADIVFLLLSKGQGCKAPQKSLIDHYILVRARLAIRIAIEHVEASASKPPTVMAALAVISTHLEALRDACDTAAEKTRNDLLKAQIKGCSRALGGTAAAFVASVKHYVAHPGEDTLERVLLFTKPLKASVDALVAFALQDDAFYGSAGFFSPAVRKYVKPIQAAGVSLVSGSTLFFSTIKTLLSQPSSADARAALSKYMAAVDVHLSQLTSAVRSAYSADLMA